MARLEGIEKTRGGGIAFRIFQVGGLIGVMIFFISFLGWFYLATFEETPSEFIPGRVALFAFVLVAFIVMGYGLVKFVLLKDSQERQKSRD
jgi:hypothetical protein